MQCRGEGNLLHPRQCTEWEPHRSTRAQRHGVPENLNKDMNSREEIDSKKKAKGKEISIDPL